jgi:hypothetical protein
MSHYSTIKVSLTISDLDFIKEACKELNLTFRIGGKVRFFYGHDQQTADYVISVPGSNYDVGLKRNLKGELELIYDKFDGSIERILGKDCHKLIQSTVYHKICKSAKLNGKVVTKKKVGDSLFVTVTG